MSDAAPSWAAGRDVPPWLRLREGSRPFVVVAPHGGRRRRPVRRGDHVNDLHTADLALELAARLDAHALVNHDLDRNDVDLNRISHLVARAPVLLDLLQDAVAAAGQGGEVPLVLLVHGWNMVLACCDIGAGLRRRDGRLAGRWPTLSTARLAGQIAGIERELAARGLAADLGRRYPASGRDNAAQLFSGRHAGHEHPVVDALAHLALDGGVDAAQLELGIPLRWPGPQREAMLDALEAALGRGGGMPGDPGTGHGGVAPRPATGREAAFPALDAPPAAGVRVRVTRDEWTGLLDDGGEAPWPDDVDPGVALQAVLHRDGRAAAFGGVDPARGGDVAARFSVVCTDGSMLLLVGEGSGSGKPGTWAVEGMQWRWNDDGSGSIEIDAPMVRYATHDAYLDLESGLASARVVPARALLTYEPGGGSHGRLGGRVRAGSLLLDVETTAFVERPRPGPGEAQSRLRLSVARRGGEVLAFGGSALSLESDRVVVGRPPGSDGFVGGQVLARVPVWRPLGGGVFARRTFGIVACRFAGEPGTEPGLFDHLEVFRPGIQSGSRP